MKLRTILFSGLLLVPLFFTTQTENKVQADAAELNEINIAVTEQTKLYRLNDDMRGYTEVKTRSLGKNSLWFSDRFASIDHNTYYRVSTNEWVKADENVIASEKNWPTDLYPEISFRHEDARVITINNLTAPIYDDFGQKTDRTAPVNSSWLVDRHGSIGGSSNIGISKKTAFQRIGINSWIKLTDATVTDVLK
jgi:hypothetical protein